VNFSNFEKKYIMSLEQLSPAGSLAAKHS